MRGSEEASANAEPINRMLGQKWRDADFETRERYATSLCSFISVYHYCMCCICCHSYYRMANDDKRRADELNRQEKLANPTPTTMLNNPTPVTLLNPYPLYDDAIPTTTVPTIIATQPSTATTSFSSSVVSTTFGSLSSSSSIDANTVTQTTIPTTGTGIPATNNATVVSDDDDDDAMPPLLPPPTSSNVTTTTTNNTSDPSLSMATPSSTTTSMESKRSALPSLFGGSLAQRHLAGLLSASSSLSSISSTPSSSSSQHNTAAAASSSSMYPGWPSSTTSGIASLPSSRAAESLYNPAMASSAAVASSSSLSTGWVNNSTMGHAQPSRHRYRVGGDITLLHSLTSSLSSMNSIHTHHPPIVPDPSTRYTYRMTPSQRYAISSYSLPPGMTYQALSLIVARIESAHMVCLYIIQIGCEWMAPWLAGLDQLGTATLQSMCLYATHLVLLSSVRHHII
jgi:hypothetical protein